MINDFINEIKKAEAWADERVKDAQQTAEKNNQAADQQLEIDVQAIFSAAACKVKEIHATKDSETQRQIASLSSRENKTPKDIALRQERAAGYLVAAFLKNYGI